MGKNAYLTGYWYRGCCHKSYSGKGMRMCVASFAGSAHTHTIVYGQNHIKHSDRRQDTGSYSYALGSHGDLKVTHYYRHL